MFPDQSPTGPLLRISTMRINRSLLAALALGAAFSLTAAVPAEAQFGKLKDKVKRKTEERIDRKTDEAAEKVVDTADPTTGASAGGAAPTTAPAAAAAGGAAPPAAADAKPGEGVWANYDFVPGERVLFAEEFANDNVGDFPRRLEFVEGNMEVVEWQGSRWLRGTTDGEFRINLPETLPERFTVEFEHAGESWSYPQVLVRFDGAEQDERTHHKVQIMTWNGSGSASGGGILNAGGDRVAIGPSELVQNVPFTVRIMADGKYVKVYMNSTRVANVPNADLGRSGRIIVAFDGTQDRPAFFRNFRVAAGGRKLYDAIAAEGRVATQGIYFDTGSDRLRPESSPTLKEISDMLKEHPELRLSIEGHTDNVGQAAANQTLSEARAAAVRKHLVETYGIDASRLEAAGLGATKPVSSNDTPEGRQSNRRVELVKL